MHCVKITIILVTKIDEIASIHIYKTNVYDLIFDIFFIRERITTFFANTEMKFNCNKKDTLLDLLDKVIENLNITHIFTVP